MNTQQTITSEQIDALYERLHREAEASGYHLNPDVEFTRGLVEGLLVNEQRYGYQSCCLLYTSPSPRDLSTSRMPSSA